MTEIPAQEQGTDELTYRGRTWRVESEPVVVESTEETDLVEVWVRRGEDIEQSGKS